MISKARQLSFIGGMARVIDIGSTMNKYNFHLNDENEDYKALKSDWTIIGSDIEFAISQYDRSINGISRK